MAIDTAERRKSVAGIHGAWTGTGVTPNSGKDQEWRQEAGYGYPGILAGVADVPEVVPDAGGGGGGAGEARGGPQGRRRARGEAKTSTGPSYGPTMPEPEQVTSSGDAEAEDLVRKEQQAIDARMAELLSLRRSLEGDEAKVKLLDATLGEIESEIDRLEKRRQALLLLMLVAIEVF